MKAFDTDALQTGSVLWRLRETPTYCSADIIVAELGVVVGLESAAVRMGW